MNAPSIREVVQQSPEPPVLRRLRSCAVFSSHDSVPHVLHPIADPLVANMIAEFRSRFTIPKIFGKEFASTSDLFTSNSFPIRSHNGEPQIDTPSEITRKLPHESARTIESRTTALSHKPAQR